RVLRQWAGRQVRLARQRHKQRQGQQANRERHERERSSRGSGGVHRGVLLPGLPPRKRRRTGVNRLLHLHCSLRTGPKLVPSRAAQPNSRARNGTVSESVTVGWMNLRKVRQDGANGRKTPRRTPGEGKRGPGSKAFSE